MKAVIGAFAALSVVFAAAARAESVEHTDDPRALYLAMQLFFGGLRGSYVLPDSPLYDQVGEAMTGPHGADIPIPEGGHIINACRYHSCEEMAAVAVDGNGKIRAIGLISFMCRRIRIQGAMRDACDDAPTLTVFAHAGEAKYYKNDIVKWGRSVDGSNLPVRNVVVQ